MRVKTDPRENVILGDLPDKKILDRNVKKPP
jgi:hypothetical protein